MDARKHCHSIRIVSIALFAGLAVVISSGCRLVNGDDGAPEPEAGGATSTANPAELALPAPDKPPGGLPLALVNGEEFRAVASEVSVHPSRADGGALPPFARGTYNTEFEDEAFGLRIGEISPAFQTSLGYRVIEKTGEIPPQTTSLSDVSEEIRRELDPKKRAQALGAFERALRAKAVVEILKQP